jgi:DNA-binding response OmpR family regulator/cytochrome c-type biogenesis protein CcmH/NrfG
VAGTILYVDDAPALPAGFAHELRRLDFELVHTADPHEALRVLREERPRLLLIEPLLRDGRGVELMVRIRAGDEALRSLPIVVVSRDDRSSELYGQALDLDASDFLCKPVLGAELLEAVLEATQRAELRTQGRAEVVASIDGTLAETPVAEVLQRMREMATTGTLFLIRDGQRRDLELRNGSPVSVAVAGGVEPLEDYLVRTKRISDDERIDLVDRMAAGLGGAREILTGSGAMSRRELDAALRQRAAEPLLETFGWSDASYRMVPGSRVRPRDALEIADSPVDLLLQGVLQWMPVGAVRRRLHPQLSLYVWTAESPPLPLEEGAPELVEPALLEGLRGDRTLRELLAARVLEERALYALLVAGFVELHEEMLLVPPDAGRAKAPRAVPESHALAVREDVQLDPRWLAAMETTLGNVARRIADADSFAILEVSEESSDAQVREAWERMCRIVPLERVPVAATSLRELTETLRARIDQAYERLRDAESRRDYARTLRETQDKALAARALEAERWFRKGERKMASKRYPEAVESFGMASHLDPDEGEYVAHLGYALYLSSPEDRTVRRESLEHLAKGIKLSPRNERPLIFLGRIYRAIGKEDSARRIFQRALRIRPDCHAARQELRLMDLRAARSSGLLARLRKS